jgi:hypothetical protein
MVAAPGAPGASATAFQIASPAMAAITCISSVLPYISKFSSQTLVVDLVE